MFRLGNKNPSWQGNKVGYFSLHQWVRSKLPKPKLCQNCYKKPPYDLANKGIYNRDFKNWEWLCRKCHMESDGRIKNLKQYQPQNTRKKISKTEYKEIRRLNKNKILSQRKLALKFGISRRFISFIVK